MMNACRIQWLYEFEWGGRKHRSSDQQELEWMIQDNGWDAHIYVVQVTTKSCGTCSECRWELDKSVPVYTSGKSLTYNDLKQAISQEER